MKKKIFAKMTEAEHRFKQKICVLSMPVNISLLIVQNTCVLSVTVNILLLILDIGWQYLM